MSSHPRPSPAGPAESPAFAFLLVAAVAGLLAGACSLLLRLPPEQMMRPGSALALLADGHAPLILLGSAVPALLGGMGFLLLPPAIGARDVACPRVVRGAAILLALSVVLDVAAPSLSGPAFLASALARLALSGFALSALGCALPLLATLLNHGGAEPRPSRLFPIALAIGCGLAVCVLPVLVAAIWRGGAGHGDRVAEFLAWPVLMIVSPPAIGLAVDVLGGGRPAAAARGAGWTLGVGAALGFQLWCAPLFGHGAVPAWVAEAAFLLPMLAVLLFGCATVPRLAALVAPSGLHAAGLVIVALGTGLASLGWVLPRHYLLSAGIAFALCCGMFVFLERIGSGMALRRIGQAQFLCLFAGLHLMLLPSSLAVAVGAASCGVSLVLLAGLVVPAMVPRERRVRVFAR